MLKPTRLRVGDTIGIVSPSWCGPALFPHRLERGVSCLRELGFKISMGRHVSGRVSPHLSASAADRAADLMAMFADSEIKGIICSIGGDHSCQLLSLLDFDAIRRNPKIFMGFSDVSVLNIALWKEAGLVSFYGPTVLTEFADFPTMPEYSRSGFIQATMNCDPVGKIIPSTEWTDEFLDWGTQSDLLRPRLALPSNGWTWLKAGKATGRLLGGCTSSLEHLRGTRFWPDWNGAILFLETSEEKPSPAKIDALLSDYANMGVLDQISGLIFGRPTRYTPAEKVELFSTVLASCKYYKFPILVDVDIGHTSPMTTIPIGCLGSLDSDRNDFSIIEAGVT